MKNRIFLLTMISFFLSLLDTSAMQHNHSSDVKIDCAVNSGNCVKIIELNTRAVFDINPKPVTPMTELLFSVTIQEGESPVTDAAVSLDLTMPDMFMGINRHVLKHIKGGRYEGKGVIPTCPHGGKLWKADVTVERKGKTGTVSYIFEVK